MARVSKACEGEGDRGKGGASEVRASEASKARASEVSEARASKVRMSKAK